jgi:hypothetical protein
MARGKVSKTAFIVEFEDGSTGRVVVDEFTLDRGDHVARTIASQKYPGRRIKELRPAPPDEQPT